jgi:hypothetical protein
VEGKQERYEEARDAPRDFITSNIGEMISRAERLGSANGTGEWRAQMPLTARSGGIGGKFISLGNRQE